MESYMTNGVIAMNYIVAFLPYHSVDMNHIASNKMLFAANMNIIAV